MTDWKLDLLKTKLAALGIMPLGGGKYLDAGTGEVITERDLESLSKASGKALHTGKVELQVQLHRIAAKCRKCGSGIAFKKLMNGKFVPINEDGTSHQCKR